MFLGLPDMDPDPYQNIVLKRKKCCLRSKIRDILVRIHNSPIHGSVLYQRLTDRDLALDSRKNFL
jgi:hypothetical protein